MNCQICLSKIKKIFSLGKIPICNYFNKINSNKKINKYALELFYCPNEKLIQLGKVFSRNFIFGNQYDYLTGSSKTLFNYYKKLCNNIIREYNLKKNDTILEIGCNDGTFLNFFHKKGFNIVGVDGSVKAWSVSKIKSHIINNFFEKSISDKIFKKIKNRKIKVILAFNVLAHTDNLNDVLNEIRKLMSKDTILITQNHSVIDLLKNEQFDTIYHEHLRYFSSWSFKKILEKFDIYINKINEVNFYGKSYLFHCSLKKKLKISSIKFFRRDYKINYIKRFRYLKKKLLKKKEKILKLLIHLREKNYIVAAVGAPMKSTTFFNFFEINKKLIKFIAEVNQFRINKEVPGVKIPIYDEKKIFRYNPHFLIIMSWNMYNDIVNNIKKKGFRGKFIKIYPKLKIHN